MKLPNALIVATALLAFTSQSASQCEHQRLFDASSSKFAFMGNAVAVSDGRMLVAEWKNNTNPFGGDVGRVFAYELILGSWELSEVLQASDAADSQFFGSDVDLDGDYAIVGAYGDKELGDTGGAAYLFELIGNQWTEVVKVVASNGGAGDRFGFSVAIEGDVAVVGAPDFGNFGSVQGAAYIFERIADTWVQTAILSSPFLQISSPHFGRAVAIHGDRIVVGSPNEEFFGSDIGAAFVFEKVGGNWNQVAFLAPSDGAPHDEFATSVDIHQDRILAGGYVFEWLPFGWTEVDRLIPGKANLLPVALQGDTAILGTTIYRKKLSGWVEEAALFASLDNASTFNPTFPVPGFGASVALDGNVAVIGSPDEPSADNSLQSAGAAYTFNLDELDHTMVGCPNVLSLGDGGVQTMILRAPAHPDSFYLVMGSATGSSPGIPFGSVTIPLNPDAYFNMTLTKANNPPPLLNTFGLLDGAGLASAYFVLPTGTDPSLAGLTLNHAYMLFDINTLEAFYASDPIGLSLGG